MNYQKLGFLASFFTALKILPNLYNVVIKKNTRGFSYAYMGLGFIAQMCWLFFGIFNNNKPLIITSLYLITCYVILTIFKFYHEKIN